MRFCSKCATVLDDETSKNTVGGAAGRHRSFCLAQSLVGLARKSESLLRDFCGCRARQDCWSRRFRQRMVAGCPEIRCERNTRGTQRFNEPGPGHLSLLSLFSPTHWNEAVLLYRQMPPFTAPFGAGLVSCARETRLQSYVRVTSECSNATILPLLSTASSPGSSDTECFVRPQVGGSMSDKSRLRSLTRLGGILSAIA